LCFQKPSISIEPLCKGKAFMTIICINNKTMLVVSVLVRSSLA
jgi:hypothetical protein